MNLTAVLWQNRQGQFLARCPSFPGCSGRGGSEDEALVELRQAICDYLSTVMRISPELIRFSVRSPALQGNLTTKGNLGQNACV